MDESDSRKIKHPLNDVLLPDEKGSYVGGLVFGAKASFNTIAFLAGKLSELHLPAVLTIEGTNHRIAETIVQASGGKDLTILTLNSLQSATSRDIDNGTDYLSVMKQNLEVLRQALYGTDKE